MKENSFQIEVLILNRTATLKLRRETVLQDYGGNASIRFDVSTATWSKSFTMPIIPAISRETFLKDGGGNYTES